jgi:hypothetical protein
LAEQGEGGEDNSGHHDRLSGGPAALAGDEARNTGTTPTGSVIASSVTKLLARRRCRS